MSARIVINRAEATDRGILITHMSVIESSTGEKLKIATLNKELAEFLQHVEIEIDRYYEVKDMIEKNPAVKTLINTFNLNI